MTAALAQRVDDRTIADLMVRRLGGRTAVAQVDGRADARTIGGRAAQRAAVPTTGDRAAHPAAGQTTEVPADGRAGARTIAGLEGGRVDVRITGDPAAAGPANVRIAVVQLAPAAADQIVVARVARPEDARTTVVRPVQASAATTAEAQSVEGLGARLHQEAVRVVQRRGAEAPAAVERVGEVQEPEGLEADLRVARREVGLPVVGRLVPVAGRLVPVGGGHPTEGPAVQRNPDDFAHCAFRAEGVSDVSQ